MHENLFAPLRNQQPHRNEMIRNKTKIITCIDERFEFWMHSNRGRERERRGEKGRAMWMSLYSMTSEMNRTCHCKWTRNVNFLAIFNNARSVRCDWWNANQESHLNNSIKFSLAKEKQNRKVFLCCAMRNRRTENLVTILIFVHWLNYWRCHAAKTFNWIVAYQFGWSLP